MFGSFPGGPGACGKPMGGHHFARHAFGFGGEPGGKCGPGAFLQGLDLSDEQVERIAELKGKTFSKLAHSKIDLLESRKQLLRELTGATLDRNKINAIAEQIKKQKSELTDLMVGNMVALAETLTPEQRKKARINKIRHFLGLEPADGEEEE
jgi:Spy/CpxP family protein refolding chaperone